MMTRTAHSSTNLNPGPGPSLYRAESPSKDLLEGMSILGALDGRPPRSKMGRRGTLALIAVLFLVPITYLIATGSVLQKAGPLLTAAMPKATPESGQSSAQSTAQSRGPASLPEVQAAAAPSAVVDEPPVAMIVADAAAGQPAHEEAAMPYPETGLSPALLAAAAQADADSKTASAMPNVKTNEKAEKAVTAKNATGKTGKTATASAGPRATGRRSETGDSKLAASAGAKRAANTKSKPVVMAQARVPATNLKEGKGKDATGNKDKDVDLIAALLTHASRPGAIPKNTSVKPAEPPVKSTTSLALAETASKREARAPNRDIVVASPGESKESLIGRCRSLGLLEGELCRIRICSGSWGADPACPIDSAVRGE